MSQFKDMAQVYSILLLATPSGAAMVVVSLAVAVDVDLLRESSATAAQNGVITPSSAVEKCHVNYN